MSRSFSPLTFYQFDINLRSFKYIVEDSGLRVIKRRLNASDERFVDFEDIGTEISKVKESKRSWLGISLFFFSLAILVFTDRISGDEVGDGAEFFWLSIAAIFFIIYAFKRKNSLFLVKDTRANGIEFIGTKIYEKRLNEFIKELLRRRNDYLEKKYSIAEGLTVEENLICAHAGIQPGDGAFLKSLTNHPIRELDFDNDSETEKPRGISSMTSEKNARSSIASHRERFISEGKYIFISSFSGDEYVVSLVAATNDPYKVMEYAGTNGVNYGIETKDIIAKYKLWDKQFGIEPVGIGVDFCECAIVNKDIDYKKLAAEIYEFCPDIINQGTGTLDHLENELRKTGRIFLWWD